MNLRSRRRSDRINRLTVAFGLIAVLNSASAFAQARPRPSAPPPSHSFQVGGYALFGHTSFTAAESFDAILGAPSGPVLGGGVRVRVPLGGLFAEVGAWRYRGEGERVFVDNGEVFPLGIPVEITVTPIEISAGWQFHIPKAPKLTPYVAGGFTSLNYQETSDFAAGGEDSDDNFNGYHLFGGAEYKITRWIGLAGEASWSTVPDAIGESGVSAAFNETDLGGTTFRLKVTIGR